MNKNVVSVILEKMNMVAINDSVRGEDQVRVIVRKAIQRGDSTVDDSVTIHAENDYPSVGDSVTSEKGEVRNGVYKFQDEDGKEIGIVVEDGEIVEIGDLTKMVVRGGQVVKQKIRTVKKRLTGAQRQALAKARKKAHTGAAKVKRLKSFMKGKMKGLHNDAGLDVSKVDLNALGEKMYEVVFAYVSDRYEMTEDMIKQLDDMLEDEICKPVIEGNQLKVVVPVWNEVGDEVDLEGYDLAELTYELEGSFDGDIMFEQVTSGDLQLQTSLIV